MPSAHDPLDPSPDAPVPLPPPVSPSALEAASDAMERDGMDLEAAAARFQLPPEALHRYHRARHRHDDSDTEPDSGEDTDTDTSPARLPSLRESGKHLDFSEKESFHDNWERRAPIEVKTIAPSAAARFCTRFPLLRSLVRNGELDPAFTLGAVILVGGGLAAGAAALSGAFSDDAAAAPPTVPEAGSKEDPNPVSRYTAEAEKVIRQFLAADSPEAKRPFLRDPDTNIPLMAKWAAQNHEPLPGAFKYIFFEELIEYSGKRFLLFSGHDEGTANPVSIVVDATAEPIVVDWQASVAYQPMDWLNFLLSRPPGEYPFRVVASISDYEGFTGENPEFYLALNLAIPNSISGIRAFVERDSNLGREIATIFLTQNTTASPTVRLFPVLTFTGIPDGEERVVISKLAAEDWMLP